MTYKAHRQRGSEFQDYMKDTRVLVLEDLETWAFNDASSKVCWLYGMAGFGKYSITLTFSQRLDEELMLEASFFCSHSSSAFRLIIPTIAYMLGRISPPNLVRDI